MIAFCYLACARLFGLKQPRVLDGDNGLVGGRRASLERPCEKNLGLHRLSTLWTA
jgi:hypothetical protein